jgi:hypothetical protein
LDYAVIARRVVKLWRTNYTFYKQNTWNFARMPSCVIDYWVSKHAWRHSVQLNKTLQEDYANDRYSGLALWNIIKNNPSLCVAIQPTTKQLWSNKSDSVRAVSQSLDLITPCFFTKFFRFWLNMVVGKYKQKLNINTRQILFESYYKVQFVLKTKRKYFVIAMLSNVYIMLSHQSGILISGISKPLWIQK